MFSGQGQSASRSILNIRGDACRHWPVLKRQINSALLGKFWKSTLVFIPREAPSGRALSTTEFFFHPIGERQDGSLTLRGFVELVKDPIKGLVHISNKIQLLLCWTNKIAQVLVGC